MPEIQFLADVFLLTWFSLIGVAEDAVIQRCQCCVVRYIFTDVSKDRTALVFKVRQSRCTVSNGLLDPQYEGTTIFEISAKVYESTRRGIK